MSADDPADPERSAVVLVGCSTYDDLPTLPSVAQNLAELREVFANPRIWGIGPDRCRTVLDPAGNTEIIDAVHEAAALATDTLVVYYAGHGLLDDGELHLGLRGTRAGQPYTAMAHRYLARSLLLSRADRRIAILDCCNSGNALPLMDGGGNPATVVIDGACVLTASPEYSAALAPETERLTTFTGQLVRVLNEGLSGHGALVSLHDIFYDIRLALAGPGSPMPQMQDRNGIARLPFVRNAAYSGGRPAAAAAAEQIRVRASPAPARRVLTAVRPIEFRGELFTDPCALTRSLTTDWAAGRDFVADPAKAALARWLREDVRDLTLPANIMERPAADERLAALQAHYLRDEPPRYRNHEADALGLAALCGAAERGEPAAILAVADLTAPLIEAFAAHRCIAAHPECSGGGCARLRALPDLTRRSWSAMPEIGIPTRTSLEPLTFADREITYRFSELPLGPRPLTDAAGSLMLDVVTMRCQTIRCALDESALTALVAAVEAQRPDIGATAWSRICALLDRSIGTERIGPAVFLAESAGVFVQWQEFLWRRQADQDAIARKAETAQADREKAEAERRAGARREKERLDQAREAEQARARAESRQARIRWSFATLASLIGPFAVMAMFIGNGGNEAPALLQLIVGPGCFFWLFVGAPICLVRAVRGR